MTKLVIQIPCFNEEAMLPETLKDIPDTIDGIDEIEILIIDDGSTDSTIPVARANGVSQIVRLPENKGLAKAFALGLESSLRLGADVIVNTDADNQYPGDAIADLIRPILSGEAEMVVGDRQVGTVTHFSWTKRLLQRLGSWVVRWASNTNVPDTTSGFRAFSRSAAMQINVFTNYTYTLETIIQAGKKGIVIRSVPIKANPTARKSRLIDSTLRYIVRSAATIIRIFLMYEALRFFLTISVIPLVLGMLLFGRFGYFYLIGEGSGHIQSLIVATIFIVLGFFTILIGLIGDLIAKNRRLSEDIHLQLRRMEFERLQEQKKD
jgi:glycosyltransferase involved in cell wall biosynthesis